MTTTTAVGLNSSEDDQIETLMAPTTNVGEEQSGSATVDATSEKSLEDEESGEAEAATANDKFGLAAAGLMSNVDEAQFGAMLKDAQQQVTEDISRYLQQTPPVQAQQAPRLIPTPQQQAQLQQQYAQLQQYQAAQQQAMQQQSQSQIMMEMEDPEDSDDDGNGRSEKRAGRRKIRIEYIEDKSRRHITFSKRKAGIMKKAYELSTLTGTQVLLLVASETGHVYTFATPKLQPLITKPEGKNLIQACLNAPDGGDYNQQHAGYEDDNVEDRPIASNSSSNMAAISQNYAAAMAGLAGYQYPQQGQASNAATAAALQAYMNQAYPAYAAAAQYNAAAAAAGYWPQNAGSSTPQGHDQRVSGQAESESNNDQH